MTPSKQILNWLTIGFEQPTGNLTENFYYDMRDNEFFSIMVVDYFMLDEEMNIASNVTTNYSKTQENSLVNRIKRIENKDSSIISIPRVTLNDRKNLMKQFVDKLSESKLIDILNQQIENQDYRAEFDFYFGNEADELTKQKWEEEKNKLDKARIGIKAKRLSLVRGKENKKGKKKDDKQIRALAAKSARRILSKKLMSKNYDDLNDQQRIEFTKRKKNKIELYKTILSQEYQKLKTKYSGIGKGKKDVLDKTKR